MRACLFLPLRGAALCARAAVSSAAQRGVRKKSAGRDTKSEPDVTQKDIGREAVSSSLRSMLEVKAFYGAPAKPVVFVIKKKESRHKDDSLFLCSDCRAQFI